MDTWNKKDLRGEWIISRKIDGIKMLRDMVGNPVSRAGKPLYNLGKVPIVITEAEIYAGSWEKSITAVRTILGADVPLDCVYTLNPLDERLVITTCNNPTVEIINNFFKDALAQGYEGLVLHQGDLRLKVKPVETYDIAVIGFQEGKGRNKGRLGAFITAKGNVGTGLTDADREKHYDLGTIIEVECMGLTPAGKFRHPRFKRVREDK